MAKQTINVGSGEYSGDGESIRIAFTKVNSNFTEIYTQAPLATTATYAQSFNTSTLVSAAVSATTSSFATTSGYALSFNTGTIVGTAVSATNVVNGTWTLTLSTAGSILLNGTVFSGGAVSATTSTLVNSTAKVSLGSNGYITLANGAQLYDYGAGVGNGYGITDSQGGTYIGYDPGDTTGALHMDSYNGKNIRIRTTPVGTSNYKDWLFAAAGSLTFPDATVQTTAWTGTFPAPSNGDSTSGNAWMTFYADGALQSTSKVTINPAAGMLTLSGTGGAGGITFPDATVQTTAWTGSVSSLVNGTSTVSLSSTGKLTLSTAGIVRSGTDTAQVGYQAVFTQDLYGNTATGLVSGMTLVDVGSNAQMLALINPSSGFGNNQYNLLSPITITYSDSTTQTFTEVRITNTSSGVIGFGYNATTVGHNFPITAQTANYVAATTAPEWTFGSNGSLTFPNATVQTTAYTGLTPNGTKASSTATGTAGQTSYDSTYFYICIATNTWRRVALGSTY